jgi:hypothetical protein
MDPYLEAHWRDVHQRLVIYGSDELQAQLPDDLRARVEERVFVESDAEVERSVYPDVRVIEHPGRDSGTAGAGEAGAAVAEPLIMHVEDEPASEGFIEIIDVGSGNRVITVIEVLSLSNKSPGEGQAAYKQKQRELRAGRVNLVEIDLLRSGHRVLSVLPERIPKSHRTTYQVVVRRGDRPLQAEIYAVPLRQRLPTVRVPLRPTDGDVTLDLQAMIDRAYQNGRYDDIDYAVEPQPPLDPDDAAWADELLRAAGRR